MFSQSISSDIDDVTKQDEQASENTDDRSDQMYRFVIAVFVAVSVFFFVFVFDMVVVVGTVIVMNHLLAVVMFGVCTHFNGPRCQ